MSLFSHGCGRASCPSSRRDFLASAGGGLGLVALQAMWANAARAEESSGNPLAPRKPHFATKAKSVIWCFLDGGPSHLDLFDPKPALEKMAGSPLPPSFKRPMTSMGITSGTPLLASTRKFAQYGQSGAWVSDLVPEIATCVDDIAFLKGCYGEGLTHVAAVTQMTTGSLLLGRPSTGAWTLYGLGSESQDLPGFIVITDGLADPPGGPNNWGPGFIPSSFQGTRLGEGKSPIVDVSPSGLASNERQRGQIDFIQKLNKRHKESRTLDSDLDARIASYELAFRMQMAAPEAVDLSRESAETQSLYGLDRAESAKNGRNCLLARRLVERGVRFVQVYMGAGSQWDAHSALDENHQKQCLESDRPIAGLLKDLKRRGLLDSTLVVWGGEFGRTPMSESGNGRDHNPYGFTMWMAGGGIKGGMSYGATDEAGLYAVDGRAHINDVHATILHAMGLHHDQLTFTHLGREERLTGTAGSPVTQIFG